jgi:hypothetical protein
MAGLFSGGPGAALYHDRQHVGSQADIGLDHQGHPPGNTADRQVLVNEMFGGLHLLQGAPVGDGQMGDHVLELAAERRVLRELPMGCLGQGAKGAIIFGREPQDVLAEPVRGHQPVLERRRSGKHVGEPTQHCGVDVRRWHEGEQHGDMGRNP